MHKGLGFKGRSCHKGFEYCGFNGIGLHNMPALRARSKFGAKKNATEGSARWHKRIASFVDIEERARFGCARV